MHIYEGPVGGPATTTSATTCASSNRQNPAVRKFSMVVPVHVNHVENPNNDVIVYAMIDTQSDCSFITDDTARKLGLSGREVQLSLSTMTTSSKVVKCRRYNGLRVRGLNHSIEIDLPGVYSRNSIPINRDHIPCAEMTKDWPHLAPLSSQLTPRMSCQVGLLLGYDCSAALEPINILCAPSGQGGPFGMETRLGWGLVGVISKDPNPGLDAIGYSHRVMAQQTTSSQIVLQKRNRRRSLKGSKKKPKKRRRAIKTLNKALV